ncbi:MAG: hypothetical protein WD673_10925 [Alphaproteobacteria bacterium]
MSVPSPDRVIVRNAETGAVIAAFGARASAGHGARGVTARVVEHEIAVPSGSVVVLATGKARDGVARAVADTLAIRPEVIAQRLFALPAVAAWDLDGQSARAVAEAVEMAGGRAVIV